MEETMKFMGMALAVGFVLGPLGMMGIGYAVAGVVLAVALAAVGGGLASALGLAPAKETPPTKDWH
jgi:fructose-1,6-bisphosphatase/sedoheptulose 1,7-bisphosphatase-like protein